MSVTSSMYTGIAGMLTASQGISVVGNNLANANTVGYKGSVITFEDTFYQAVNSAQGNSQVGTGSSVSAIYGNFSQGSMETSTDATDLAINGDGYFKVVDPTSGEVYYTRAGDFRFDEDGYLTDSHGYQVQGWAVDDTGSPVGSMNSIKIDNSQSPPSPTSAVSFITNLDSTAEDNATNATNPFFALMDSWDGTSDTPLGDGLYEYQTTITVYDENGSSHDLTVYFDPVDDSTYVNGDSGSTTWEFIVTCDPSDDQRTIDGQTVGDTSSAGLLMAGTLTFNASGEMTGLTAFTQKSDASGALTDLSNWTAADISDDGFPLFTANFTGADDANTTDQDGALNIELNLGIASSDVSTAWDSMPASADLVGTDYSLLGNLANPDLESTYTTSYDSSSSTLSQSQDGYASGYLMELAVDTNGVITGTYSNGQIEDLYVVGLANFANDDGLARAGGNLYQQTRDSGEALTGTANTGSLGAVQSSTLEQSNVDMGTEMVKMITYQRVYDASSKVISTADTMLQTVIALKR